MRKLSERFGFLREKLYEHFHVTPSELLNQTTDVLKHISDYIEDRHPVNLAKCGFEIWKTVNDNRKYADDYFQLKWVSPISSHFSFFITKIIAEFPHTVIKCAEDNCVVKIARVHGEEIGWVAYNNGEVSNIWVRKERKKAASSVLRKVMWERMNHSAIVMFSHSLRQGPKESGNADAIAFQKDDDLPGLGSEMADKYVTYLKRCIEAKVSRTVLFYGPPGTGKSTVVRCICDKLQLKTLRIRVEDVHEMGNNCIFDAIDIFDPDVVILDDLDRAASQTHLLETMERFHHHIKLVFATVNDRRLLDDALLRPGRFDEVIRVMKLDDHVIKTMLGTKNADVFDNVRNWPIAFIQEYVTRRQFMSKKEALLTMQELQTRVDQLMADDDDTNEVSAADFLSSTLLGDDSLPPNAIPSVPPIVRNYIKKQRKKLKLKSRNKSWSEIKHKRGTALAKASGRSHPTPTRNR